MIQWFIFNFMVFIACLLVIIEKSFGADIGFLLPLAWILVIITAFLIVKDALFMR